jgi:multidrug transporter EmrE-like cation transporter
MLGRYILKLPALVGLSVEELAIAVAPTLHESAGIVFILSMGIALFRSKVDGVTQAPAQTPT